MRAALTAPQLAPTESGARSANVSHAPTSLARAAEPSGGFSAKHALAMRRRLWCASAP